MAARIRSLQVLVALALLLSARAYAAEFDPAELSLQRPILRRASAASASGVANSNCPQATCDTVWVGHSSSGPGGAFLGVGVGGTWDFDTDIAGTDSTQGWNRHEYPYTSGSERPAITRPEWAYDYGNMINEGNTNLWHARDLAGRKYVRRGVISAWHADDMTGIKKKLNDGAEPSAVPITGARSAWCGLRTSGDTHAVDALTGNAINGDRYWSIGAAASTNPDFPGYCSLWDQLLYKDFPSTGTGTVEFRVRTDMSNFIDTVQNGTGWFNPDPTNIANFVNNPADSFMVYVGSPNESAFDINRRWFSEVLDYSKPVKELFAVSGHYPFVAADTLINRGYAGVLPAGGAVRVVFRVKTNRVRADGVVGNVSAFNSKDGAAVIDQVKIDGGTTYGFDAPGDITARELIGNLAADGGPWAGTGRPREVDFHIEDVSTLLYEDLCGSVGSPTRLCNLAGNVAVGGNKDDGNRYRIEQLQSFHSPTIDLAVRTAAPGTKNGQGIDKETASRNSAVMQYDLYTGFMSLDESIFLYLATRFYGPGSVQPVSGNRCWSPLTQLGSLFFLDDPYCFVDRSNLGGSISVGNIDSLRIVMLTISQGYRFGGTNLGNTRGTYFDNFRVGFIRAQAPALLSQGIDDKYQDQFPVNESVTPGDNASFDTTTAYVHTGHNIVVPSTAAGVVSGDSIVANSVYLGDGVSTGVRLDLVFRIDPGPGNYSTKGNRGSPLVNPDPAHPFFASYLANNGAFGTPGGHGGSWNRDVWNSARMDSAEINYYPILSRGIGGPAPPAWMGTLHEQDPHFGALGIAHNVCFLINPAGATDQSNTICSGTPPVPYGAVSGTTLEGTKILPDGWFTPGTHVEYFLRRSLLESPGTAQLLFDTTRVYPQDAGENEDLDQERWSSFDVLPDMWKSTRYTGAGLACLLFVDAADRRGSDPAYRGAADTMGYGKNNGATSGWKGLGPKSDPNDPAGFVAANLGQYGMHFDHYDVRGAETNAAGRPGVRLAPAPGAIALKADKSGPSAAQLAALYIGVLHLTGDATSMTVSDGSSVFERANDIGLYGGFLNGATFANRRSVWLSGEGIMADGALNSDNGTILHPFLTDTFGADLVDENYKAVSGSAVTTIGFLPVAPWNHPGRVYGLAFDCATKPDQLKIVPTVDGATEGAQYEHFGAGPWTSSVYRDVNVGAGRYYRTLFDGFDLANLRGHYANLGQIATLPGTDFARLYWFQDAWFGHLQLCYHQPPLMAVGDLPGSSGEHFANANLGSYPNPAFAGRKVSLRFTLAAAGPITLKIYDVAGREVARVAHKGVAGPNTALWDGVLGNGARALPGVYFYALEGVAIAPGASRTSKLILLSNRME